LRAIYEEVRDIFEMPDSKNPRFRRKRDHSEKAAEAGVKSGQDVAALIIARADPKPQRKP